MAFVAKRSGSKASSGSSPALATSSGEARFQPYSRPRQPPLRGGAAARLAATTVARPAAVAAPTAISEETARQALGDESRRALPWFTALGIDTPAFILDLEKRTQSGEIPREDMRTRIPRAERRLTLEMLTRQVRRERPTIAEWEVPRAVAEYTTRRAAGGMIDESIRALEAADRRRAAASSIPTGTPAPPPPTLDEMRRARREELRAAATAAPSAAAAIEPTTSPIGDGSEGLVPIDQAQIRERLDRLLSLSTASTLVGDIFASVDSVANLTPFERALLTVQVAEAIYPPAFRAPSELGMRLLTGMVPATRIVKYVDIAAESQSDPNSWKMRDLPGAGNALQRTDTLSNSRAMARTIYAGSDNEWLGALRDWVHAPQRAPRRWWKNASNAARISANLSPAQVYVLHEVPKGSRNLAVPIPEALASGDISGSLVEGVRPADLDSALSYILENFSMPSDSALPTALAEIDAARSQVKSGDIRSLWEFTEGETREDVSRAPASWSIEPRRSSGPVGVIRPRYDAQWTPPATGTTAATTPGSSSILEAPAAPPQAGAVLMELDRNDHNVELRRRRVARPAAMGRGPRSTVSELDDVLFGEGTLGERSETDAVNAGILRAVRAGYEDYFGELGDSDETVQETYRSVLAALEPRRVGAVMRNPELAGTPWFTALGVTLPASVANNADALAAERNLRVRDLRTIATNMGGRKIEDAAVRASEYLRYRYAFALTSEREAFRRAFAQAGRNPDDEAVMVDDASRAPSTRIRVSRTRPIDSKGRLLVHTSGFFRALLDPFDSERDTLQYRLANARRRTAAAGEEDPVERVQASVRLHERRVALAVAQALVTASESIFNLTRKTAVVFPVVGGRLSEDPRMPSVADVMAAMPADQYRRLYQSQTDGGYAELVVVPNTF